MPVISVVIPCYNQDKYVAECLDSVLAQTFEDFEVVAVNDGSTDNSQKIIESYAAKDSRIRLINQPNCGVVAARNAAVSAAGGIYIYPLDADDKIAPDCLEKLYRVISTTNNRVVASEAQTFDDGTYFFTQPKLTKYQMYGRHGGCVISALFYKEDFERFGGYKQDFSSLGGEDMDYWLNYIDAGLPMTRVKDVLFFYRMKKPDESYWKKYSKVERIQRKRLKEKLLRLYHPKMKWWALAYAVFQEGIFDFIWKVKIKNGKKIIRLFGIPVYHGGEK